MAFYGQAGAAAQKILRAFEDTNSLPKPLAQIFIRQGHPALPKMVLVQSTVGDPERLH